MSPADMRNGPQSSEGRTDVRAKAGKYLTFRLSNEDYGLEILKVQEIIGVMTATKMPRMPAFVRGIINLRGKLIPVIDMRSKFSLPSQEDTAKTCIIVVQVAIENERVTMGICVDAVSEVLNIQQSELEPAPTFGTKLDTDFMLGLGKVGNKVVMLLDIDRVLTGVEVKTIIGNVREGAATPAETSATKAS